MNGLVPTGKPQIYAIALGSNQPRSRTHTPYALVKEAMAAFSCPPFRLIAQSPIIETPPIGPSLRRYANGAALIETPLPPKTLLTLLKHMEKMAGRRRGRRWGARPLDLDIILWSGGHQSTGSAPIIPHPRYRERSFVLAPLMALIPDWRDPITGRTVRQEYFRLKKPAKIPKAG